MSFIGQLHRGRKWYNQRNNKGELPEGIVKDANKMADVNTYLEYIKDKDEKKVELALDKRKEISREGKKRHPIYKELISNLKEGKGFEKETETKSKGKK